ncbi:class I SAM-dependent methyltransferase [Actinoplanes sp. NBRC 103695]|uniref:class I SAM-dependent methyltransferase n=1 Tax=Actinoplanes sp. NBRC 103695 TaxID=3032202 RepID=UPI002552887B|nr:class I SAM-dependent methyltransferase [Actinoplanes sp. NBRC 103695]
MDEVRGNRRAWETASEKYVQEYDDHLALARSGSSLFGVEQDLLRPILADAPEVIHLQSGWGLDDIALVRAGAASVVGVDFSTVAARTTQRRADELGVPCRYVVGSLPGAPLAASSADLVYTGKGGLIWMPDIDAWAADIARLLRPGGWFFIFDGHPAFALWTWDVDQPRIRPDRSYFARSYVNDSFPANGAVEFQWTLGQLVTAVVNAGLEVRHLSEHPEPFWKMHDIDTAASGGRLPNTYALLARKRDLAVTH